LHAGAPKAVRALGIDDKRQITMTVAGAATGVLLPGQVIFQGKTKQSLPAEQFLKTYADLGWDFTQTVNHWASLETSKAWSTKIYMPYCARIKAQLWLPSGQASLLLLDCWTVHLTSEFRDFVKEEAPWCQLKYVLANTTSVAQPMDVAVQSH